MLAVGLRLREKTSRSISFSALMPPNAEIPPEGPRPALPQRPAAACSFFGTLRYAILIQA